jgi:gamma-glutamyltranspeptidase/glutathione hydrolase
MKRIGLNSRAAGAILLAFVLGFHSVAAEPQHGAVATVQALATDAAVAAMKHGGNAIDGTIAAALTLGVVDGFNSGIGGGCFMLVRRADGSVVAIDGRETAPQAGSRDMFLRNGQAETKLSQTGPLASGVPGSLAAYDYAARQFGKLPLRQHLLAAAKIAADGFVIDPNYARRIEATAAELKQFPASREIFLHADGTARRSGETLVQVDLAKTYRAVAEHGVDWFYRGAYADATADWMKKNGGLLTRADFEKYEVRIREPVRTTYRGHEIVGFPPPSSGGVHVAQILNILEQFDLKSMGRDSADFIHVITEAMKLAFADRAFWLGDPDFVPVPRGLVNKDYARQLAKTIRMDRAAAPPRHGEPARPQDDVFGKHTTHFSISDGEGNWVACTATVNTTFGSKVVIPGTGVVLNNQMDDFSLQPGVANYFGLIGGEQNAIAPGKRPLSSMSPTIVLLEGKPILSVGAAGGPTIISQVVLAVINVVDFKMDLKSALARPRFHHQWSPDELKLEKTIAEKVQRDLEKRGHKIVRVDSLASTQAVEKHSMEFSAEHEPRGHGKATVW